MGSFYEEFIYHLERGEKEKCVVMSLQQVDEGKMNIKELYTDVLAPALNSICNENQEQKIGIWEEHFRSSVVRTIIESCFPYVIKERDIRGYKRKESKVVILCPEGEHHDMGARMAADFFTLAGYESIFIGSSTPKNEFITMVDTLKPQYIALSVISYYNLVSAKKTIESIRNKYGNSIKIFAGGHALSRNPASVSEIGADALVNTYEEIMNLGKEDN